MINDKINSLKQETIGFNQERVFHISQIQNICEKYYLRFLNIKHYKGSVDNQIPFKITTFETAHDKKCQQKDMYIIAPAKSFQLEEKPKDPLLFYKINDDYFYLIHKWGNDLSIFNRLKSIFSNKWVSYSFIVGIWCLLSIPIRNTHIDDLILLYYILSICFIFFGALINLISGYDNSNGFGFFKKNEWDLPYKI
jgi:hypothetical protein